MPSPLPRATWAYPDLTDDDLIRITSAAENDQVGALTGTLDQSASLLCAVGHALFIDFASATRSQVPSGPEDRLVNCSPRRTSPMVSMPNGGRNVVLAARSPRHRRDAAVCLSSSTTDCSGTAPCTSTENACIMTRHLAVGARPSRHRPGSHREPCLASG